MILPPSYTLSSDLLEVHPNPFGSGSGGDVHHGTLSGSKVCVKRIRAYTQDESQNCAQVRPECRHSPCLSSLTKFTVPLPRGCDLETPEALKHLAPPRCHYYSPAADFRLDDRWGSLGVHKNPPRCRQTWTCECPSCHVCSTLIRIPSFLILLRAFVTSTPAMWFTGTSREYVTVLDIILLPY